MLEFAPLPELFKDDSLSVQQHPLHRRFSLVAQGFVEAISTLHHGLHNRQACGPASTSSSVEKMKPLLQLDYTNTAPNLVKGGKDSNKNHNGPRLPLSGAEPLYDDRDERWWLYKEGAYNGSYSYALQDYRSDREDVAVPGDVARAAGTGLTAPVLTCKDFVMHVLSDNQEHVQCVKAEDVCPIGHSKVMSFVDMRNREADEEMQEVNFIDHHFYVQHKDAWITLQPGDRLEDMAEFLELPAEHIMRANPELKLTSPAQHIQQECAVFVPDINVWSHKPDDYVAPRLYDGDHRVITDPRFAAPAYSDDEGERYQLPAEYCCSFCVRKGRARTGAPAGLPAKQRSMTSWFGLKQDGKK